MNSKYYALFAGFLMLVMGVWSLIPGQVGPNASLPYLRIEQSYGLFLGIFPMNILNKLALVAFGIGGIIVSRSDEYSIKYAEMVFFVMGALALAGLFPLTNTLGGMWPLFGAEIMLHGFLALVAGGCAVADTRGHRPSVHA